ncbi:MAG: M48 family metallopeptidase [Nitrospirales bacterium]
MKEMNCLKKVLAWSRIWSLCMLAACTAPHYGSRSIRGEGTAFPPLVHLHDVAFPLLVAAADWCVVDQEPTYGFLTEEIKVVNGQAEVEGGYGVSVVYVHPQLPAASAGVMPGDRLTRINERTVAGMSAEEVSQLIRRMTVARIQPLQLDVVREGRRHTHHLRAVPACPFSVQLVESDQINGIADGRHIGVTTGMMRFVSSEDELAWVVAHEIAHNVLNHSQNARLHMMLHAFLSATTGVPGDLSGKIPPRRSLEARADYVGAYIMARAGYDVRAIKQFWRRLEHRRSGEHTPTMDRDHPTTAERLAAFEETLKEIEEKRQRGESLEPLSAEP